MDKKLSALPAASDRASLPLAANYMTGCLGAAELQGMSAGASWNRAAANFEDAALGPFAAQHY